jgi:release factor glutamine methyltransferase
VVEGDGRLPSWSAGGTDGRRSVDQFLNGLGQHLAPGGLAVMTHNVFLDLGKTQAMLCPLGLQARVAFVASAPLTLNKLACLSPQVLARFTGQGIHKIGDYWFVDFDVIEISWKHEDA